MSSKNLNNFNFAIRPSAYLLQILTLIHAGAILAISLLQALWWIWALSAGIILASYIYYLRRYILRTSPYSVIGLLENEDGSWLLQLRNDPPLTGILDLNKTFVSQQLIILNFKIHYINAQLVLEPENKAAVAVLRTLGKIFLPKKINVPLFTDSISPELFRKLRIFLLQAKR